MVGIFGINETLNTLKAIFEKHKEERVCVLGTICAGKSTLLSQLPGNCEDLDDVLWPNLPEEETAFLRQSKWTEEMGNEIDRLVYKYVKIKPGCPLFTTVIVDCEAVVYLDISDELLAAHCKKRGIDFAEAKQIKEAIEDDWNAHKAQNDKLLYYIMATE
jgi:energy-coupling factor transporter ATP-binding protein EcfA2